MLTWWGIMLVVVDTPYSVLFCCLVSVLFLLQLMCTTERG